MTKCEKRIDEVLYSFYKRTEDLMYDISLVQETLGLFDDYCLKELELQGDGILLTEEAELDASRIEIKDLFDILENVKISIDELGPADIVRQLVMCKKEENSL